MSDTAVEGRQLYGRELVASCAQLYDFQWSFAEVHLARNLGGRSPNSILLDQSLPPHIDYSIYYVLYGRQTLKASRPQQVQSYQAASPGSLLILY
jgi:hypothetical protein